MYSLFSVVSDLIHFILAGNKDMHKVLDEFEFYPHPTTDYGAFALKCLKNLSKTGVSIFSRLFDAILFKLAGIGDFNESLGEFKFRSIWTIDHRDGGSCP